MKYTIEPLRQVMIKTAETYNTALSTTLGRSILAKYIISCKYLHSIQNEVFSEEHLVSLREAALLLTWTRARTHNDTHSARTHIANSRVSQPLHFGGLRLPDPCLQTFAIRFAWAHTFVNLDSRLMWVQLLEAQLRRLNRPSISCHMLLGANDWEDMTVISPFWFQVFSAIARIIKLSHKYDRHSSQPPL